MLAPLVFAWSLAAWSPERQHTTFELHYAPVWYRPIGSASPDWSFGSEIGLGVRVTAHLLPFLLTYSTEPALRILDSKSFALSILQRVYVALALGPLEPEVGGGFSTITVDVFHGAGSAELFSPRAEAGVWLHAGSVRVGVHAYGEYLWRWFGNTDYLLRGISIAVGFEARPPVPQPRD
jgi:hypothetical protein